MGYDQGTLKNHTCRDYNSYHCNRNSHIPVRHHYGYRTARGKPKLVIWGRATFVPPQLYWVEQKVRKWASEKGVDVEITWISVAEIGRKLLAAVEAGSPPYVVINGHPVAVFAEKGLLVPLDDIVDKLGRDDIYEIKLRTS